MRRPATLAAAIAVSVAFGSAARATLAVTVCNEASAGIHVAFANQVDSKFTTTGWWSVPLSACQDIDFTIQGNTLYFTADSDPYASNGKTVTTHWGEQLQLFVGDDTTRKFNFTDADKGRSGAKAEKFQLDDISDLAKLIGVKVHIKAVGSSVDFTTHP